MLRGRRFRRVFHGVHVAATLPDSVGLRVAAARLVLPDSAVFSHQTAALLRQLPLPDDPRIHVTLPRGSARSKSTGIVSHESELPERMVRTVKGRRVVSPERNFVELAGDLSLVDLVVLGDAAVRHGWTTVDAIRSAAAQAAGQRNSRVCRRAADLVSPRVDSPMETQSRLLLVLAGLPCPEPGQQILDEHGQWVATVDLQYREQRIALEYDGDLHRRSKRKWRQDATTRRRLRELGWDVIVLTADDILIHPAETLRVVSKALSDRGHPSVPGELSDEWTTHFPGRTAWL